LQVQPAQSEQDIVQSELMLEFVFIEGQRFQEGALLRRGGKDAIIEPRDLNALVRVLEGGKRPDEPPRRVRHDRRAAGMHVRVRAPGGEFDVADALESAGEADTPVEVLAATLPDAAVRGREAIPVLVDEPLQIRAADLLFALLEETDRQR